MQTEWHDSCSFSLRVLSIEGTPMRTSAARAPMIELPLDAEEPEQVTLLELVRAVSEVAENEREVVATVCHMLKTGRVKLCGNFRHTPYRDFG